MEPQTVRRNDGRLPARHIDEHRRLNALVAGTTVLTLEGALPVELLAPGDRVITRDSGVATLRRVRHFRRAVDMVAIRAGSLGKSSPDNSRPDGAALLPADQEILMRGWRAAALFGARQALVPLSRIKDGHFVRGLGTRSAALVALSFERRHILYGDGLELASADPLPLPG